MLSTYHSAFLILCSHLFLIRCIGGGVDLVTAADVRLATRDAVFSIAETKLAIVAGKLMLFLFACLFACFVLYLYLFLFFFVFCLFFFFLFVCVLHIYVLCLKAWTRLSFLI